MDDRIRAALAITRDSDAEARTIDITTIGARSGRPRRIEIVFHRVAGEVYLSGYPGPRNWYANLLANPSFVLHLKHGVVADLPAVAEPVLDADERRRIFEAIVDDLNQPANPLGVRQPVPTVEEWTAGSPLVRVRFVDDEALPAA